MSQQDKKRVLVLGPNDFTWRHLHEVPNAARYDFIAVCDYERMISNDAALFDVLLEELEGAVEKHQPHGIMAFWDFPATCLAALVSERHGLPTPGLRNVIKCEHKLWSRVLQQEVIPDAIPAFEAVDPFDDDALAKLTLPFPFWLKPVKGVASMLGFRINNEADFRHAIEETRRRIHIYGKSFSQAMRHADLPDEIAERGAEYCLAEQIIDGKQVTVEGFVHGGQVQSHGVVDSIRQSNHSTFSRYEYPSSLPSDVLDRMIDLSTRVLQHFDYDDATFNIEYFYEPESSQIWLLEINPRISQSHAALFQLVDGAPNFSEMVSVAVGEQPPAKPGGQYPHAAKLFYRTMLHDGVVTGAPSPEEVQSVEKAVPGVEIQVNANLGQRLSDLPCQDSYSYELALMHVGGESEGEILQKYQECVDHMTFTFTSIDDTDVADGHHHISAIPQLLQDSHRT